MNLWVDGQNPVFGIKRRVGILLLDFVHRALRRTL
jgi:hypothetical protein